MSSTSLERPAKNDVLAKFESVVEHHAGVGDARSVVVESKRCRRPNRPSKHARGTGCFKRSVHSLDGGLCPSIVAQNLGNVAKPKTNAG